MTRCGPAKRSYEHEQRAVFTTNAIRTYTWSLRLYNTVTAIMTTICRCSVRECNRTSRNSEFSFFRFPKDTERAKIWVMACQRQDLADRLDKLHNSSYRVCGAHFRKEMFASDLKNRLQRLAVPTIFAPPKKPPTQVLAGTTIYILQAPPGITQAGQTQQIPGIITYATNPVPALQKAPTLTPKPTSLTNEQEPMEETTVEALDDDSFCIVKEELDIAEEDVKPPSPMLTQIKEEPQEEVSAAIDIDSTTISFIVKEEPPSPSIPDEITFSQQQEQQQQQQPQDIQTVKQMCHRQVQTSSDMVLHAPRVQRLKKALKTTENYNFALRQKISRIMYRGNKSVMETITFQDYKRLTYAFCPSKSVADNVIQEVSKAREAASVSVTVNKAGGGSAGK